MSEYNWEPGDIALVQENAGLRWAPGIRAESRCLFGSRGAGRGCSQWGVGDHWHIFAPDSRASGSASDRREAKPLVTLDPESDEDARRWRRAFIESDQAHIAPSTMERSKRRMRSLLPVRKPPPCEAFRMVGGAKVPCSLESGHSVKHMFTVEW